MATVETGREVRALSRFLNRWCTDHPQRLQTLIQTHRFVARDAPIVEVPPDPDDADDFQAALRAYRNESLAVIAWRDLAIVDDLETTLAALSMLAERCIEAALGYSQRLIEARYGVLRDSEGHAQRLIVIGMGKLGGGELNFSSDIDLIFAYRRSGESDGERSLDADGYFKRVARAMIQCLNETTANGFVYRVDTRLRPFGDAGALVASLGAMEGYYQAHGREWERYAWVKARPVAGDIAGGQDLIRRLRPFVYRRYLDYGTFQSIREMKALIDRQVAESDLQDNIKLGSGGIREIEFIVQAFQLIRGGQEPALQDNRLLRTLARLAAGDHLPAHTADEMESAYRFLRRVENRLQMADDRQTHDLPESDAERSRLARAMAYDDWPQFKRALDAVRQTVHAAFEQVFVSPQAEQDASQDDSDRLLAYWEGSLDDEAACDLLAEYGVNDVDTVRTALAQIKNQHLYRALGDRGRRWIARLIPLLFAAAARASNPDRALTRTVSVLDAIVGRTTYMALLVEHPVALSTLMRLCAASEWITSRISAQPALLDSLLDPRQLYRPPRRAELAASLDEELAAIDTGDVEHRMDALRRFTETAKLRIAAADVTNAVPLMIVSDNLTELAEVVLDAALTMAMDQMVARYGQPQNATFAIIAYGKLGGLELGYTSDLDLVFVYNGDGEAMTDGERSLTCQAFFTRLAQRLMHMLSTQTAAGRAYEVDMRLRPSGQSGLMVTPIDAFERYQKDKAWTWEHQALVRARPVVGDTALAERFSEIRHMVLARERDPAQLATEVQDMRDRMRRAKDESTANQLDVKQMPGGLIDIEFMAQFAALAHGAECRELFIFTDAIRILETMESAQLASYDDIHAMTHAYRDYRRVIHSSALQRERALIARDSRREPLRQRIASLWERWFVSA